jgi:hypothetical protein
VFVNNTALNGDGNDVYVEFASDFFNNANNINNDCTYSFSPQLLVGGVCLPFLFFLFFFLLRNDITHHVF